MQHIHANLSASISELKKNPTALLTKANGRPVAVLNHNKPAAYLIPAEMYAAILDTLEDHELSKIVEKRLKERQDAISVDLDDL
jgi:antitoxin StbD